MILQTHISINITTRNITQFKNKGYNTSQNPLEVKIEDLSRYSRARIKIECDECKKESTLMYYKYVDNFNRYGFYTCKKCSTIKKKMTYNTNYGVDNPMKVKEIQDKGKKTKLDRYGDENYNNMDKYIKTCNTLFGTDYALQNKEIRNKIKITCNEKYNVDYIGSVKEIHNKGKKTKLDRYGDENYNNIEKTSRTKLNKHSFNIHRIENNNIYAECDNGKNHNFSLSYSLFYYRKNINVTICPICNPIQNNVSIVENDLLNFIQNNYFDEIIVSDRKILNGKELDIYLPKLKLAFEFNGIYWHSDVKKEKNYHKIKTDMCLEKEIQLFHIYEDEWLYKQNIIKSMILNKLNNEINILETEIKEVNNNNLIKKFLNDNHLQGYTKSTIKIGLFNNDELISLMIFKKSNNNYELLRFCNKLNINIISFSKLFEYFIDTYNPLQIITYIDRSHSNNSLYEQNGFKLESITEPNCYYVINGKRIIKKQIKPIIINKIHDSGSLKLVFNNKL